MPSSSFNKFSAGLVAVLATLAGWAGAVPFNIVYNFDGNPNSINVGTEEHFKGEYERNLPDDVPDQGIMQGYLFSSPPVIYLDENYQLTNGITVATKYQGFHSKAGHRWLFSDGSAYNQDYISQTSALFLVFPASDTRTLVSGTVTWTWNLFLLPDNTITIQSDYQTGLKTSYPGEPPLDGVGQRAVADNTEVTFEAPEFIYLNRNLQELTGIDTGTSTIPADNIAWYKAVNLGYAINGQTIQGVERFFKKTITDSITVVWKWDLEFAVFNESDRGNPTPVGRSWVKKDAQYTATVNRTIDDATGGTRSRAAGYTLYDRNGVVLGTGPSSSIGVEPLLRTDPLTISAPVRVKWDWRAEVRYRFDASIDPSISSRSFNGMAFVRYYNEAGTALEGSAITNVSMLTEAWLPVGRKVEVGAYYRTVDRCFTMANFVSKPDEDLQAYKTISLLKDMTVGGRVARVATSTAASPSEMHFYYGPTIFRAEVPLGQSFDALNPNLQLVPELCDGAVLQANATHPAPTPVPVPGTDAEGLASGKSMRWDQLGKQLFPVHPGSFQLTWGDGLQAGVSYQIEIVTGFPTQSVTLSTERENADGSRRGTAPDYVRAITLPAVDSRFPGAPLAHYRHHFDTNPARNPPTMLDLSTTDNWKFQALTFSAGTTGGSVAGAAGNQFTVQSSGKCVLLYTYRPNPDEVAGNAAAVDIAPPLENYAVRIVDSSLVAPIRVDHDANALGRSALLLDRPLGILGARTVDPGLSFAFDFWLNTKGMKTTDAGLAFPRPADNALVVGLTYEPAEHPEDRFLAMDPANAYNFTYDFQYTAFAGDALIPPYPLNLVIGNVTMLNARGNSMQVNGINQRSLWRDVNHNA